MYEQMEETRVIRVPATHADEVISVLWESFYDYPVMRHVLRDSGMAYGEHLHKLISLFVGARVLLDDVMLGIRHQGQLVAVATTSDPARPPHPEFETLREQTWAVLGPAALERYMQFVSAWEKMAPAMPQLHVNMLGVRRQHQRRGLARTLLQEVHHMAEASTESRGVSLTTEDERNVPFYQHQGYEVIGYTRISDDLQTWSLFRYNP